MTRLLITGASGFAGRHLLAHLRQDAPHLELLAPSLDITDQKAIEALIATAQPDILLHLAGISSLRHAAAHPERTFAVNVLGSLNLAEAVLAHAPACRFIFVSSTEVYGRACIAGEAVTEATVPEPVGPYALSKANAEEALAALPGLKLLRLRVGNHTGPGQLPDFVVPAFARQIARIEARLQPPVLKTGNLDSWRDFLDVHDICTAYTAACALPDFAPKEVLNIASGKPQRIGTLLEMLLSMARVEISVQPDAARQRQGEIRYTLIDASRAKARLNWAPQRAMRETLAATLAYWRAEASKEAG